MTQKKFVKKYSSENCFNPVPQLELLIANSYDSNLITKDTFIVDTGADITLIKKQIFEMLELKIKGDIPIEYADGRVSYNPWSYVYIELSPLNIKERLKAIIQDTDSDNLLGRNFLNKYRVLLDGPNHEFTIST